MGVTGLWTVVQPCARPIKLETLNKKRLAVDASIWIYQFLKAVRDKEGNALRNSHLVGFFRRICKLLYFGIKPVFVFDGGAPVLKRQTIANRRKRREGRREDAVRTAGKLLAVQMRRVVEEEQRAAGRRGNREERQQQQQEEEEIPDNPVYVEEAFMTDKEKRRTRQFRKTDAYHLPTLGVSLEEMGAPNDPRIMSREELEEYARQFQQGEDVNLYDFSKIDFDSPFFISLPATDRYNILNAARLRSRLRMGYSKEQLDNMFPDRMAFSKFQIERVKERNDLTQRLMNINGMNGEDAIYGIGAGQRIAGERNREYVLVKDSAVEGGWALGVVSNSNRNEGEIDKPIDVDQYGQQDVFPDKEETSDDDEGFEDVPIEGLNRLPKLAFLQKGIFDGSIERQMREISGKREAVDVEDDSLFVQGDSDADRNLLKDTDSFFEGHGESEDEDLQKAIEMSLESPKDPFVDDFAVSPGKTSPPPTKTAPDLAPESEDDEMDFATALARSKRSTEKPPDSKKHPFDGPLPFESIKLELGKPSTAKKSKNEPVIGGKSREFVQPSKNELPLPPWFSGKHSSTDFVPDAADDNSLEKYRERTMTPDYQFLKDHRSPDVIDAKNSGEVVDLGAGSEKDKDLEESGDTVGVESNANKGDGLAAAPSADYSVSTVPITKLPETTETTKAGPADEEVYDWDATDDEKEGPSTPKKAFPSPEFEDVVMNPEEKIPEVSEANSLPAGIDQQEALVEEDGDVTDPENGDLMRQLAAEAEEHARFAATLNPASQTQNAFDYEQELKQLRSQQQKDRRDADEVTQIMITECQQLLTLFGLPYITAPMEAEAQCAELVSLGLVDGIVTDDSDIFLFGGTRVYKNMFNQSKFVECYLAADLEKEYALHRRKLISFAHLLGSDYTEGIAGIGPVTALEILTEFQTLEEFRDWWTQIHQTGKPMPDDMHSAFHKKFKKTASKIFLPPSFPDSHVDTAYLEPEVDSDPSPFQWGVPDLNGLRNFLMATIGWSQERTDEILVPVIRDMNRRDQEGTQSNITSFFTGPQGAGAFAPRVQSGGKSRMEKAFSRLRQEAGNRVSQEEGNDGGGNNDSSADGDGANNVRRKGKGTKRGVAQSGTEDTTTDGDDGNLTTTKKRKTRRRTKAT